MKKSFDKLSDKVFELQTQLEKIDVLTNDLYSQYFALIDPAKPHQKGTVLFCHILINIKRGPSKASHPSKGDVRLSNN